MKLKTIIYLFITIFLVTGLSDCGMTEITNERKLADIKAGTAHFSFICPRGKSFRFLLGVIEPKVNWTTPNPKIPQRPQFKGIVTIKQAGKIVFQFPISSSNTARSNWLESYGMEGGYILHSTKVPQGQDLGASLEKHLKKNQSYDVLITFSQHPPVGSSIWLSWLSGPL